MAEIADEFDEYLSDDHEEGFSFKHKTKEKAEVQQNVEPSSTQNEKVHIQVNVFKAIHVCLGVFLAINMFGAITKD